MHDHHGVRSVAYFVNWAIYGRNHNPQDLPAEKLTHILYAFANIRPETGEVYLTDPWADSDKHYPSDSWNDVGTNLYGCLKQIFLLKKRNRHLKVLLSIGGWTYSSNFAAPISSHAGRSKFATSALSLVRDYGFDGLDIDFEYPKNDQEAADYVTLLKECREVMDHHGDGLKTPHHFELTVACPAGKQNYEKMHLREMDHYLDFWNMMAYDFAGSWDATAGHQSNINHSHSNPQSTPFSASAAISAYKHAGVHPSKIVLGMPLYGRAFENTAGPGHPYSGVGQGTWENGVHDYKKLPLEGSVVKYDEEAVASYCFKDNGGGKGTVVSYDTVAIARMKAEWVVRDGLGGAMWWESSADKEGNESLIGNVVDVFQGSGKGLDRRENCLEYPESKYENLKKGFPGE